MFLARDPDPPPHVAALERRGRPVRTGWWVAGTVVAAVSFGVSPLDARQTEATLDAVGSVVEYDGFLVSGAASISPTLRFDTPNASLGVQGSWVVFESGNQIVQATAAGAWLTPGHGRWRGEFSGSFGLNQYADAPGFGHLMGRARLHLYGETAGGWISGGTGWTFEQGTRNPVEIGIGGWTLTGGFAFAGNLHAAWVDGAAYVDVGTSGRWATNQLRIDGDLGIRTWSSGGDAAGDPREGVFAELSTMVSLTERLALTLAAGSYPSDPPRGTLGAEYISLGVRLHLSRPAPPTVPTISRAVIRAAEALAASDFASRARLELDDAGTEQLLRVLVGQARSVELMGDFTDWQPVALARVASGIWEISLPIPSGVHRLNVRIDGGEWLVPLGTRIESTEFGGAVGIVVVP